MKERIRKFMDYKNITPVELADAIRVQRSNISHILNGRNKPGAGFLEKFLLAFPQINARWLLTGEGEIVAAGDDRNDTTAPHQDPVRSANEAESWQTEHDRPQQTAERQQLGVVGSHFESGHKDMKTTSDQTEHDHKQEERGYDQMELRSEPEVPYGKKATHNQLEKKHRGKPIEKIILLHTDGTFQSYEAE